MSGRDSYPIFERDAHGFPVRVRWVRVRWVDRHTVPDAFLDGFSATHGGEWRPRHTVAFTDAGYTESDTDPRAPDSDPTAHDAT